MKKKTNYTYIGGQAVIQGVMMRGKRGMATVVRNDKGELCMEAKRITPPEERKKWTRAVFLRGIVNFFLSFVDGMQALLAEEPYLLEPTDVKADFLSFEEIADRVIEKYERLLLEEGTVYTVERAMLAVRIYDEASQYGAEPIWYFEVTNNMTYPEVLMFNAITGEEIYLQS